MCISRFAAGHGHQHRSCGTHDLSPDQEKDAARAMQKFQAKKQPSSRQQVKQTQPDSFSVNVYFHLIQTDGGYPVVSDALILKQFTILKDVYSAANSAFQFDLKGITRMQKSEWVGNTRKNDLLEGVIGQALRQGGPDTMNIYIQPGICDDGLFGYASLPKWRGVYPVNKYSPHDHIHICQDYLPGRSYPYDLGYTLVHEAGHWLGVSHPFKGSSCSTRNSNDQVDDTSQTSSPIYGCPSFRDSCPDQVGSDLVNNFMDYTDDRCMTAFTPGQLERMVAQYTEFRHIHDEGSCATNFGQEEAFVKFELQFDANYEQTQWGVVDWSIAGSGITRFFREDTDYDYSNQLSVHQDCLATKSLYEFFVSDSVDGGFESPGFAALTVNGRELFRSSQFGSNARRSIFVSAGPADCGIDTRVYITLFFDNAPEEVSWELRNPDTNEVVDDFTSSLFFLSNTYNYRLANSFLHIDRCLPNGRYDITFSDSGGNGMLGEGYWRVSSDMEMFAEGGREGGAFSFTEMKSFDIGPTQSQAPTIMPTSMPSSIPSIAPSVSPSSFVSQSPSSSQLNSSLSGNPPLSIVPTLLPSTLPSVTKFPSNRLTLSQGPSRSSSPTGSLSMSLAPSQSVFPTFVPTETLSALPSTVSSQSPSLHLPSASQSESMAPSKIPSELKPSLVICFPGGTMMMVKDKGATKLSDVQIGDSVMGEHGRYEVVYSFGHYSPSSRGTFLEVTFTQSVTLQVSKDHMVFVNLHLAVPASMLRVGDAVVGANGERLWIVSIKNAVADGGVFAPFTPSGKIVVNGILASSFVAFGDSAHLVLTDEAFKFSYQWIALAFEFPHRLVCYHLSSCPNETYTDSGISTWVAMPHAVGTWLLYHQRSSIRLPLLVLLLAILTIFYVCACTLQILSSSPGLYTMLLLLCALSYASRHIVFQANLPKVTSFRHQV